MHGIVAAVALLIGGGAGVAGIDAKIAWGCVALAGLFMLLPI